MTTERHCSTCAHFRWAKGPTGRRRSTEAGNCAWPLPWPDKWPWAYSRGQTPSKPTPFRVWPQEGCDCPTWQEARGVGIVSVALGLPEPELPL